MVRVPLEPNADGSGSGSLAGQKRLEPGKSTAVGYIVEYRLGKIARRGLLKGRWLDCGCADGGYSEALLDLGASRVAGLDPWPDRIEAANKRNRANLEFCVGVSEKLDWPDATFQGVLLNEVFEHVDDEMATLREIRRVLSPDGHLALFSPNRFFPLEGHGIRLGPNRTFGSPVPLVPWLPKRLTRHVVRARNYWPWQLAKMVRDAGFEIVHSSSAFPQFEVYPWIPARVIPAYRRVTTVIERTPGARWLGVSCFILARPLAQEPVSE